MILIDFSWLKPICHLIPDTFDCLFNLFWGYLAGIIRDHQLASAEFARDFLDARQLPDARDGIRDTPTSSPPGDVEPELND